jgi:hypothetical protein
MIKSELKTFESNKKRVKLNQLILLSCDKCGKEYEKIYLLVKQAIIKYKQDLCGSCRMKWQIEHGERNPNAAIIKYNLSRKGKTFNELFGEDKANVLKQKIRIANSGNNNPMFNTNAYEIWIKKYGKTEADKLYLERTKLKKTYIPTKETRLKHSISVSGDKNPMFGKPAPQGSGNGWSGWYRNYYFRSILELSYLKYLLDNNIKFESGEKRDYKITYYDSFLRKKKNYFADFYLIDTKELVEIKPSTLINIIKNKDKFAAAKNNYGDKFKIITENDIKKLTSNEIILLYELGELIWLDRYKQKFLKLKKGENL